MNAPACQFRFATSPRVAGALVLIMAFVAEPIEAAQPAVADIQFEKWVFRRHGSPTGARRFLVSQLNLKMEDIDRACDLTDNQRLKIELAGQGDIKRFFARYEDIKDSFRVIKQDPAALKDALEALTPLQASLNGVLFGVDSVLGKSLPNILSDEQRTSYDGVVQRRRTARHRAAVEMAITSLEQATPISGKQRKVLLATMLTETRPPRTPGYDVRVMTWQLAQIPERRIREIFDDVQWQVIRHHLDQARALEKMLRLSGSLPDENEGSNE